MSHEILFEFMNLENNLQK